MAIDCFKLRDMEVLDYDSFSQILTDLKALVSSSGKIKYSVLLFDSIYCFVKSDSIESGSLCRFDLFRKSDLIFKISTNHVEILKNRFDRQEINKLFAERGVVIRDNVSRHIDEE